jgi:P4 family phage/plasmid primase-like protien
MSDWVNFFNKGLDSRGTEDICDSDDLRTLILQHDGAECYHSAFDMLATELKLEEDTGKKDSKGKTIYRYHVQTGEGLRRWPKTVTKYSGIHRPALGYVWLDFDSKDGGETALGHTKECLLWLNSEHVLCFYSGSKGFHLGVPFSLFGLPESAHLGKTLNGVASQLKKSRWSSLDVTVFNPQRKFRVLGSQHPKTKLYKIALSQETLTRASMDLIKSLAKERGQLSIPHAPTLEPLAELQDLASPFSASTHDAISLDEFRKYRQPDGKRAFEECLFLKHCKESPAKIDEPSWYASASIVGRFKDGRSQYHAMSKGHPSYNVTETDEKLEQALQGAGPRTCKGINALWGKCSECVHFDKIKSPIVILDKEVIPSEATGFYFIDADAVTGEIKKKGVDYQGLVRAYRRDFKYFRDAALEKTYTWTGTHYEDTPRNSVTAWCESVLDPKPLMKVRNEFRAKVESNYLKSQNDIDYLFFDSIKGKLNLSNGVLDVFTSELTPHDDSTGFRYVLPYEYNPAAKCPVFDKFLDDVTLGRKDLQQTLLEFMGFCLWPSYDDHCFLWLTGSGRNGKSTFMEILRSIVGSRNTSNVLLDFFEKPNYLELMNGKLVNISEESDSKRIDPKHLAILKALSSGSVVEVDQKYQLPYSMTSTAKLVFSSNTPPNLSGTEVAIKSRMIIVPFDLQLETHTENGVTSAIDWQLLPKIKEELPGILNVVLFALRNFAHRMPRKIFRSAASVEAANDILRDSDKIEEWLQDCTELNADSSENINDLYQNFREHFSDSTDDKYFPTKEVFAKRLKHKLSGRVKMVRKLFKTGEKTAVYFGIKMLSKNVKKDEF